MSNLTYAIYWLGIAFFWTWVLVNPLNGMITKWILPKFRKKKEKKLVGSYIPNNGQIIGKWRSVRGAIRSIHSMYECNLLGFELNTFEHKGKWSWTVGYKMPGIGYRATVNSDYLNLCNTLEEAELAAEEATHNLMLLGFEGV